MSQQTTTIGRREFIASSLTVLAGSAFVASAIDGADEAQAQAKQIPTRSFGKTGRVLPILGMGSSPIVARWATGYGTKLLSIEERTALVRHAYDRGVRYFDTGRSYYDAEEVMCLGLKGVASNCVIASKVTVLKPEQVRPSVERSLKVLGVNSLDIMQIHSSGAIEHGGFGPAMKIHAELVKLRDEGLFHYIGLTTHVAFETVYQLICTGGFDQALLAICHFPKGMDTLLSERNLAFREKCLEKAQKLGMAVVAMKVMGVSVFGRMSKYVVPGYAAEARAQLPGAAMRWVMNDPRVSLMAIGMGHAEEIDQNAALLASGLQLTNADQVLLTDYGKQVRQSDRIKRMRVV